VRLARHGQVFMSERLLHTLIVDVGLLPASEVVEHTNPEATQFNSIIGTNYPEFLLLLPLKVPPRRF